MQLMQLMQLMQFQRLFIQNVLSKIYAWSTKKHDLRLFFDIQLFGAWWILKGHTYLNKPAAESCKFV